MYGNLKPGGRDPVALRVDSYLGSLDKPVPVAPTPIAWELVLLLAAEFLSFAVVLTPLIVDNASDREIETFWRTYSLLALAACGPYILLTTPVAAGYSWFVQRWPLNLVTWLFIILSLACVVHIASVPTDPRGVFIGCCSITSYLLLLVVVVYFDFFFRNFLAPNCLPPGVPRWCDHGRLSAGRLGRQRTVLRLLWCRAAAGAVRGRDRSLLGSQSAGPVHGGGMD